MNQWGAYLQLIVRKNIWVFVFNVRSVKTNSMKVNLCHAEFRILQRRKFINLI